MENKYFRTEYLEILIYLFTGLVLFVLLPIVGGFFLGGFLGEVQGANFNITSYLGAFITYFFLMIGALGLIIYPISRLFLLEPGQHPATQKDPKWWTIFTVSLIHSPEENGLLYRVFDYFGFVGKRNPMKWSLSILRITILSILVFGLLGILQTSIPQLTLSSVPNPPQQITVASDIIFGAGVPAFTENGTMFLVLFFLLGLTAFLCSKFKLGLLGYGIIALIFIPIIFSFLWGNFHSLVYHNSDVKFFSTLIFGFFGSLITIVLASFIPFLTWHFMNNFFIKLKPVITAHEYVIPLVIGLWVLLLVIYILTEFYIRRFKKRKEQSITIPR